MTEEQKEIFDAVNTLNEELFKKYPDNTPTVSVTFANYMTFIGLSICSEINIPEFCLYNSVQDNRIYDDLNDKYESYYDCIKRNFELIKEEINNINI